ncbi:ubiquitin carboxyl-terminal hydrolase 47-like [Lineus longissimus]|uniref:ubiquitin carboxyl-terminal hydrolase 47-like n=1 Tax=Lineus longissimus TaxID=88925 RepID=UPI00315DB830
MAVGEDTMIVPTEQVCAADEAKVLCIIRDLTSTELGRKTLNLPESTTAIGLVEEVAKVFRYELDTFVLTYDCAAGGGVGEVSMASLGERPLRDICYNGKRNNFSIGEKDGTAPKKLDPADGASGDTGQDASGWGVSSVVGKEYNYTYAPQTSSYYYSDSSYSCSLIKSDTGYVGLINQAMTCYLNSLLQTVYMTPEFRNALYRWEFDGHEDDASKSIPYQLQALFLQLQMSKGKAVETTGLTKSFGWDSSEAWQQHDVQELCRVMFDALETKWKNTDQADLINKLYQGKMKDYVKCLECGYESAKTDVYLDIPLVIRPFGSEKAHESVADALNAFIQPETLEGSNQYFCEKCDKKCDAHKGLKFVSFPYLLTLQLKRFDFDYTTMHRIKLNDKLTFPQVLNLNNLIHGLECKTEEDDEEDQVSDVLRMREDEHTEEAIDEGIDLEVSASGTTSTASSETSSICDSSEAAANNRNAKDLKTSGPYVYELFSIMIHSGSAAGGHYYAYIKSFKDGQWYSFNDQHVTAITFDDIQKTYGGCSSGNRGYYSSTYMSSTNAYMLMYRLIDKEINADFMQADEFPDHIKVELRKLKEREENERKQREIDRSTCKIKLFCEHPEWKKRIDTKFEVNKDMMLPEATEQAYKQLGMEGIVPLDCCRLVKYDEFHNTLEKSFDDEEDNSIGVILGGVKSTYSFDLLLEIKQPEKKWQTYKQGGVTCRVHVVDVENDNILPPVNVRAYTTQTVAEFQKLIGEILDVPTENMRCVLERAGEVRYLSSLGRTLKGEGFIKSNKVFIEYSGQEDQSIPFIDTQFHQILDRYENTITLHVNLPSIVEVESFVEQKMVSDAIRERIHEEHEVVGPRLQEAKVGEEASEDTGGDPGGADIAPPGSATKADETPDDNDYNMDTNSAGRETDIGDFDKMPDDAKNVMFDECVEMSTGQSQGCSDSQSVSDALDRLTHNDGFDSQNTTDASDSSSQTDQTLRNTQSEDSLHSESSNSSWQMNPIGDSSASSTDGRMYSSMDVSSVTKQEPENWDNDDEATVSMSYYDFDEQYRKYFKAYLRQNTYNEDPRQLTVFVDKRISLTGLKKELEQYVQTTSENFKVFRVYPNSQEFESTRLSDNLMSFGEESCLNIKLGRALRKDEYRVKVYQLLVHEQEPIKFLIDTVFAKGMTVLESKKLILLEIKKLCDLDIPLNRCRLRKKTWKNPGEVYIDSRVYVDDVPIFDNWEIFVEVLNGEEKLTKPSHYAIYIRRWRPSKYELEPFDEIVIDSSAMDEFKNNLNLLSGIPIDCIEYAKCRGTFPCESSLLEIHTGLEWNPSLSNSYLVPPCICDNGCVVYYRDSRETLMELSDERRREIQQAESIRLSKSNPKITCSPRKEKALKIYTDGPPSSS